MPTIDRYRGNKWRGRVKLESGKEVTKLFGTGKKYGPEWQKAKQWEMETRKAAAETSLTNSMQEPRPLAWVVEYLEDVEKRFSKKTFVEKRDAMKRFREYAGDKPLREYTPGFVLPYLQKQCKERSGYAANKDRKNLSAAWKWGSDYLDGFVDVRNPFQTVRRFPEERHDRYIPPEEDFWKAYNQAKGQDQVFLLAFLHLGARRGELFRLKWAHVDFVCGRIRLSTRKTKDGSWRYDWLPMTEELSRALAWWNECRPYKQADHVFVQLDDSPSPNNKPGEPFTCRQHFMGKLCKRAGVKAFGFHAIRHMTAVVLYKAGKALGFIQKVLRHMHPSTTEKYLRSLGFDLYELREGMEVFDGRGPEVFLGASQQKNPLSGNSEGSMYTPDVHHQVH